MRAILDVILLILQLYTWIVIATAIMSWLIAFDVVNFRSDFVRSVWNTLNALTEPVLRPIRNVLPQSWRARYFARHLAAADLLHRARRCVLSVSPRDRLLSGAEPA